MRLALVLALFALFATLSHAQRFELEHSASTELDHGPVQALAAYDGVLYALANRNLQLTTVEAGSNPIILQGDTSVEFLSLSLSLSLSLFAPCADLSVDVQPTRSLSPLSRFSAPRHSTNLRSSAAADETCMQVFAPEGAHPLYLSPHRPSTHSTQRRVAARTKRRRAW